MIEGMCHSQWYPCQCMQPAGSIMMQHMRADLLNCVKAES